jgi:hypothetical protein
MKRMLCLVIGCLSLGGGAAAGAPDERLLSVLAAIRRDVSAVREATAESNSADKNLSEICFRVGILYTALQELAAFEGPRSKSVRELVGASKSLPSFCGDKERASHDPAPEAVPAGDLGRLSAELAHIDHRATLTRAPLP